MNRDFDGKVARFADALDDETRTMHTEIDVENPGGVLKEGMYADAKIVLEQHDDALTVPVQALDRNNSRTTVLTVDTQGRVEPREIKLGVEGSDRFEVLSGLSENDCVIVGNQGAFHAGEKVRPRVVSDNLEGEGS